MRSGCTQITYDGAFVHGLPYSKERYLTGSIPSNLGVFGVRSDMPNPGLLLAQHLLRELSARGITVTEPATYIADYNPLLPERRVLYAHKDIAFNFGMWISPVFQLYVVKSYQALIEQVNNPLAIQWEAKRVLSKVNYVVHADAVKDYIIPKISAQKIKESLVYASEADMLNIASFGCTAKDWEEANPTYAAKGLNLRDTATINQLVVMANLESMNAELIKQQLDKRTRLEILTTMAKEQLESLNKHKVEQRFQKLIEEANLPKSIN